MCPTVAAAVLVAVGTSTPARPDRAAPTESTGRPFGFVFDPTGYTTPDAPAGLTPEVPTAGPPGRYAPAPDPVAVPWPLAGLVTAGVVGLIACAGRRRAARA